MARESEFLALGDLALRAVIGPNSRHLALIEDRFKVLVLANSTAHAHSSGTTQ